MRYDIVPDAHISVHRPDVVIVEGLNVLQPPPSPNDVAVSDLFDFSIYVDAEPDDIAQWYTDRFLALRRGAFSNPSSFFNVFA
ncbi:type I pantothenate kinase, partial [Salmonella enterica subsp. enterica serovar Oranienburg]|nr:type I pantothenate kinase [Salmonella enterica subsp. enterica serovar Oranienburg]